MQYLLHIRVTVLPACDYDQEVMMDNDTRNALDISSGPNMRFVPGKTVTS